MDTFYYRIPFGTDADDLAAIPIDPPGDGSVCYTDGWTPPYEYDLTDNPAALPYPRGQNNQLLYDLTNNIKEYQEYGSPNFITSSDNGGTPFPYPAFARVYYMGQVYENQVDGNTGTPGTDATWLVISGNAQGQVPGAFLWFGGVVAPAGYFACDGSVAAQSRSTYNALYEAITLDSVGTLTNTSTTVTAVAQAALLYPGMPVEGTGIPAGTTVVTADSITLNVVISQAATASGVQLLTFFPWGNGDGSTTFDIPNSSRRGLMCSGGTGTTTIGNQVGQLGGVEAQTIAIANMPAHSHPGSNLTTNQALSGSDVSTIPVFTGGNTPQLSASLSIASQGSGTALNIVQPMAIGLLCIKY